MVSKTILVAALLFLAVWCGVAAHEVPGAEDFQHFLWPSSTSADTRLAHSSISSEFRLNRRRLLSSSSTAAQADNGQGVIEYKSVGFNIDGADFATFFSRAYANQRATGVRISPGTYHVSPNIEEQVHLNMRCGQGARDGGGFEVDFTGVFLYFTDQRFGAITLSNCSRVDLHGPFEIMYTTDQLDFVQGTIVGINEDQIEYTVQVDDAYPADRIMLHSGITILLYDAATLLMKPINMDIIVGGDSKGGDPPDRKSLGGGRFSFKAKFLTSNVTVGDLFTARAGSGSTALTFDHMKHSTARDFTIYHAGGFGIFEPFARNNSYINVQIRPFPQPLGRDGKLPLLSTSWDGIHVTCAHNGALIQNSYITNTADDAIASMGFYYSVAKVQAAQKTVIVATDREISFNMGDLLVFYAKDGENLGIAKISNMFSVDQPSETEGKPFNRWTDKDMKYDDASFMEVHLESWPAGLNRLKFDDTIASPSNNGNGFAIVNNTIGNLRGRGMLVKSSNGVIAHNRLFNLKGGAIQLSNEFLWAEADFVHSVLVLNNTINSYSSGMFLGVDPPANADWSDRKPGLYTNSYNVDFVNNTIANCGMTPLGITSAADVTVINNTFVNVLCFQKDTTLDWYGGDWQVNGALLEVANVRDVTFSGNSIVVDSRCKTPYGNYNHPIAMVNATNVHGLVPVDSLLQTDSAP